MKFRVLMILAVAAVAAAAVFVVLRGGDRQVPESFDPGAVAALPAEKREAMLTEWFTGNGWAFEARVDFLKWLVQNQPELAQQLVRGHAYSISDLPQQLSQACYEFLQAKDAAAVGALLDLGREVFPNDPYVLGVTGIAAFLGGRREAALNLLEQAETWRRDIPMVDFYLGGLLAQSESAADRARAKALLTRVANSGNPEFSELAGLMALTSEQIPLIAEEFREMYDAMKSAGVFRPDNKNLNTAVLRILLSRAIEYYPEQAVAVGELLLQYPGAGVADKLVLVQVAQNTGQVPRAAELLESLTAQPVGAEGSAEARLLARVQAIQLMLTGDYAKGLEAFAALIAADPDDANLPNQCGAIFRSGLPISVEKDFLVLLLKLNKGSVPFYLSALQRLFEIDPLREDEWRAYATDNLLQRAPGTVAGWLIRNGGAERVIPLLSEGTIPLSEETATMLVEALLKLDKPAEAQAVLAEAAKLIPPATLAYLRARTFLAAGAKDRAYEMWREAHNAALGTDAFPLIKNLGFLAAQLDQPVTALQSLYSALSAGIPFAEDQARALLDLTLKYGNLNQSIRVAEYLDRNYPGTPVYQNNLAYFKFLAEEDMDAQVELMRKLTDEYPDVSNYRLTLALGLVKLGRKNEADRLIQNASINWSKAGNRAQLIYAVVLSANNQRVVAEGLIHNIDLDQLIPEERALLETM